MYGRARAMDRRAAVAISPGTAVKVVGLVGDAALNGSRGEVRGGPTGAGRYAVVLDGGRKVAVKPANLVQLLRVARASDGAAGAIRDAAVDRDAPDADLAAGYLVEPLYASDAPWAGYAVSDAPPAGAPAVGVAFLMPDGRLSTRRFAPTDRVGALFAFAASAAATGAAPFDLRAGDRELWPERDATLADARVGRDARVRMTMRGAPMATGAAVDVRAWWPAADTVLPLGVCVKCDGVKRDGWRGVAALVVNVDVTKRKYTLRSEAGAVAKVAFGAVRV